MILPAFLTGVSQRRLIGAGAGVALIVAVSLVYQRCRGPSTLAPAVRDSVAVITASRAPDSITHAVVVAKAETGLVTSAALSAAGARQAATAQQLRALADSAARLAAASLTAQDSARHYRTAFAVERQRSDSLEGALTLERRAADSARASALSFKRADSLSQFRLRRVEQLNVSLRQEVERIGSGCKLLPGIRCPTRKEVVVGSALLTYIAARKL